MRRKKVDTTEIRKQVRIMMVELDLDRPGQRKALSETLSLSYNSFIMALSGHRQQPHSLAILKRLKAHLDDLAKQRAA